MNSDVLKRKTNIRNLEIDYWNQIVGADYDNLNFNIDNMNSIRKLKKITYNLSVEEKEYINKYCQNDDLLIYMLLLAVFKVTISSYFQSENFCIGLPQYLKLENQSINNSFLLFPCKMNLKNTFKDELISIKNKLLRTFTYQFLELKDIYSEKSCVDKINIFYCMDTLHSEEQLQEIFNLNNNDLTLVVVKDDNGIRIEFNHWGDTISNSVNIINNIFKNILSFILKNMDVSLKSITILDKKEQNKIFFNFNNTHVEYNNKASICQLFEEQVLLNSDKIALVYKDKNLTYRELNQKANSLGRKLRLNGVKKDVVVGIMVERSLEMVVAILAVLKANGAYLPIDPQYPQKRIEFMINDSGLKIILTQKKFMNSLHNCTLFDIDNLENYCEDTSNLGIDINSYDLAYVIYTSGTTGKSKGVMLENIGIVNLINTFKNSLNINKNKKILQFASISFDAFAWELFMAILLGAELYIPTKEMVLNPAELSIFIRTHKISVLTVPPFVANELDLEGSKIELVITAGSEAKKSMIDKISQICRYINAYGPTECSICATLREYKPNDCKAVTIGGAIANCKVFVVDKQNRLLPIGVSGELCIESDGIARGYMNNELLTEQKFIPSILTEGKKMYKTGDLAKWTNDGQIQFLGRIDQQVKIRGYRIEKAEIENQLMTMGGMREVVVIDKGEKENKYLCAYYISDINYSINEIRNNLKENLPEYMIPSFFISLSEMPLTINGKIDCRALPDEYDNMKHMESYEAPGNTFEQKIIDSWEKVLGIKEIGINDNFFNIGGNSLNAIRVVSLLQESDIKLNVSDIFIYQNIKEISKNYIKIDQIQNDNDVVSSISEEELQKFIVDEKSKVNALYKSYVESICTKPIICEYTVAEIQKMSHIIGLTKSVTKIELPYEVDAERLEKIICSILNQQNLLRAAIVEKKDTLFICEYDKVKDIHIPIIDLSMIDSTQRLEVVKEIIKDVSSNIHWNENFGKDRIPHGFVLVKNSSNNYILYFLVNHIIFDGMSSEILKNCIFRSYVNNKFECSLIGKDSSYSSYVEQINGGPRNIGEDEIIERFYLLNFRDATIKYFRNISKRKDKLKFSKVEFELSVEMLANQDCIWEFAFNKFIEIYRKIADVEVLPINILNMGRKILNIGYFNTIGEFLDIIPYVCNRQKECLENIENYIGLANDNCINFLSLLNNCILSNKYEKLHNILSEADILNADIPTFNYLGIYDADYHLSELIDFGEQHVDKNQRLQRGANCYVSGNKLFMFIDIELQE